MAYDSKTKKITAPVSIYDLQVCFGTDVNTIAPKNAVGKCLCKMPGINKWSLHKPVRWGYIDRSLAGTTDSNQWWMGRDGDYGIDPGWHETSPAGIKEMFDSLGKKEYFTYKYIDGEAGDVARIVDYDGYVHNKAYEHTNDTKPVSIGNVSFNGNIDAESGFFNLMVGTSPDNDLITINQLAATFYFGFAVRIENGNETNYLLITSRNAFGNIPVTSGQPVDTSDYMTFYKPNEYTLSGTLYLRSTLTYVVEGATATIVPIISKGTCLPGEGYYGNGIAPLLFDTVDRAKIVKTETTTMYGSDPADVGYKAPSGEMLSASISYNSSTSNYEVKNIRIKLTSNGGDNAGQPYAFYVTQIAVCKFAVFDNGAYRAPAGNWGFKNYDYGSGTGFVFASNSTTTVENTIPDTCTAGGATTVGIDTSLVTGYQLLVSVTLTLRLNGTEGKETRIHVYKYFDL